MATRAEQVEDEWLALRCQAGEPGAFADLVGRFERPLLYFILRLVRGDEARALDVLQEVWIKAFRTIRRLESPALLRAWLYRLAHGSAVDELRRDSARRRAENALAAETESVTEDDPTFDAADAAAIHAALDALEPHHRDVLALHFLEGYGPGEIASIVGVPPGTVKSRLHYAKRAMKELLLQRGDV